MKKLFLSLVLCSSVSLYSVSHSLIAQFANRWVKGHFLRLSERSIKSDILTAIDARTLCCIAELEALKRHRFMQKHNLADNEKAREWIVRPIMQAQDHYRDLVHRYFGHMSEGAECFNYLLIQEGILVDLARKQHSKAAANDCAKEMIASKIKLHVLCRTSCLLHLILSIE